MAFVGNGEGLFIHHFALSVGEFGLQCLIEQSCYLVVNVVLVNLVVGRDTGFVLSVDADYAYAHGGVVGLVLEEFGQAALHLGGVDGFLKLYHIVAAA